MTDKRKCSSCAYFLPRPDNNWGECRFNPPIIPTSGGRRYPECKDEDFCSKWVSSAVY